jgi:hypothetical protein
MVLAERGGLVMPTWILLAARVEQIEVKVSF